ncbi:S41 family peptidase [Devosia limi]|uniref:S41 family peptidase n=1 Tax=Devosia limi TaxID=288995 RepID=UPI000934C74A|nr:S41 family peptidase [Devosia limi]
MPSHPHAYFSGIIVALILFVTPAFGQGSAPGASGAADRLANMALFGAVFDHIRGGYVDAPDERELVRAAVQGMLTSLDPHSNYLSPDAYDDMREGISGEYAGVGLQTQMIDGAVTVMVAFEDTPAGRVGIRAGDVIIAVDGISIAGFSHDEAVSRMRGPTGSKVTIAVRREGVGDLIDFALERAIIATPVVRWSMENDVALVTLASFSAQAAPGLTTAVDRIYAQRCGVAPKGLILDLRNNRGGLVDQAVLVADAFLRRGAVVLIRGRSDQESARFDAQSDALDARLAEVPLIVLINGASASAAEIVAGALQDHARATLIGTRSFGKGSVQSIISLGGNGAIRLTTARYYTPSNRSIQALGIVPDIEIEQMVPPELAGADIVQGEASLVGHLTSEGQQLSSTGSSAYVPLAKEDHAQLQYALRLIAQMHDATSDQARPISHGGQDLSPAIDAVHGSCAMAG